MQMSLEFVILTLYWPNPLMQRCSMFRGASLSHSLHARTENS